MGKAPSTDQITLDEAGRFFGRSLEAALTVSDLEVSVAGDLLIKQGDADRCQSPTL